VIAHLIKMSAQAGKSSELLEFLQWDAEVAASHEPGTLRFDVYAVPDEPDSFYLYEMYASEDAFARHRDGAPFKAFVDHIVPNVVASMDFLVRSASPAATNASP
jgi:quinol monooxygenase YgiN